MQINDVCVKQRGDKPENVTLHECQQIGHQTTTLQDGERVCGAGVCVWLIGAHREKNIRQKMRSDIVTDNAAAEPRRS